MTAVVGSVAKIWQERKFFLLPQVENVQPSGVINMTEHSGCVFLTVLESSSLLLQLSSCYVVEAFLELWPRQDTWRYRLTALPGALRMTSLLAFQSVSVCAYIITVEFTAQAIIHKLHKPSGLYYKQDIYSKKEFDYTPALKSTCQCSINHGEKG
ncbi:hypothetical protein M404DRAFT_923097 [Pisolithus tinctorius Marx 270]|uniref:Uncharacterized protein n=1 Tax=Pisolithus tinctorius Marx 270 TaxID=870435 RepID=A0A0C3N798_PISTI|nr:hypothetical protein M404DRAFT_923097 [Pisolithus tinctorius Marx 270]